MKYSSRRLAIAHRMVFVLSILLSALVVIKAESITKSYEFGLGTQYAHSAMRSFSVPCGKSITATVRFQRSGPDNAESDIPAKIDLREPDTAAGVEGPIVKTESIFVSRANQSKVITGPTKDRGCSFPWRVRIRHAEDGAAPYAVTGTIAVTFTDSSTKITVNEGLSFTMLPNSGRAVYFGSASGLHQGKVEVSASWIHKIVSLLQGPLTISLTFELLDPSGAVVASAHGCASNNLDQSCRLTLRYTVTTHKIGQWKLKISAGSVPYGTIADITPKATLQPDCP